MNRGFTLIEVMLYIGLFTLLIGSVFVTAYQIIEGTNKINIKTTTQEEGNFVMRKIDWLLTGLDSANILSINGSGCSQTLTSQKINYPSNPITLRINSNTLEIKEASGSYIPITTSNVAVTCLKARIIPATGSGPSGVTATTTINGIDFSVTKYIRK